MTVAVYRDVQPLLQSSFRIFSSPQKRPYAHLSLNAILLHFSFIMFYLPGTVLEWAVCIQISESGASVVHQTQNEQNYFLV